MTKQDFIQRVLTILNEADNVIDGATLIGADMVKIDLYVENLYPAAWRRAVNVLPRHFFKSYSFAGQPHVQNKPQGTGYVVLPDDFLVLTSFKMRGWDSACLVLQPETPAINSRQANEYTRGTWKRPVCVRRVIVDSTSLTKPKDVLFYYSMWRTDSLTDHGSDSLTDHGSTSLTDHIYEIETALYIKNVKALTETGGTVDIDERLIEPLAYLTASTVLTSMEKYDLAKMLDQKFTEIA
ncbi:MAG: hypothetical protein LBN27_05095 [Prevotellaceae bacterium]|jgi:hypothetical protein|nr:hypothetical protein [Prevotellaceae bacterium]